MVIDNASVLFPEIEEISEVQELIKAIYNPICKKGKALDAAQKAKQKEVNAQKKEQDRKTFNTWPRSISLPVNKNRSGFGFWVFFFFFRDIDDSFFALYFYVFLY